jgi:AcrR family transcriptional regulator
MGYDSNETRRRILAAACAEFAEHGVAGARVDRIAASAGANKRAIYDYFGDKEALFATVLEREMTDCAEAVALDGADLAGYAQRLVEYQAARPHILRLLMWEALEFGGDDVPGREARTAKYEARAARIAGAGAGAGEPDDRARELLFFTMAMANWGLVAPQLRSMVLGPGYDTSRLAAAVGDAVRTLAKREG